MFSRIFRDSLSFREAKTLEMGAGILILRDIKRDSNSRTNQNEIPH